MAAGSTTEYPFVERRTYADLTDSGGLRSATAAAAVAVFFTNFDRYFVDTFGLITPLYWMMAFLCVGVATHIVGRRLSHSISIPPIVLWCFGYVALSLLWYIPFSGQTPGAMQHLEDRVLSVMFLVIMTLIFSDFRAQHSARIAIAVGVVFAAAMNVYELLHPGTFSVDLGRSAGLYLNPNQSASALVLGMICCQDVVKPRWRPFFLAATAVGVLLTFSRSGMIGWLFALLILSVRSNRRLRGLLAFGAFLLLAAAFVASPAWEGFQGLLNQRGVLSDDVQTRLEFFATGETSDTSTTLRVGQAELAWNAFQTNPLIGGGTGASVERPFDVEGPHNSYLSLMVDHGFVGMSVLPLLVLAATWGAQGATRTVAVTFATFVMFWGLFSHNVLEEGYVLITVALITAMSQTSQTSAPD